MGHQILTLTILIFNRWKEKLKRRFSARSDRPLPLKIWKHYRKCKHHGKKQKGRILWDIVALTSAYNVDDKVKQSNGTSIFDTNASFVVCDNSANTHICNNRDMFVTFNATTAGLVATIGGKLDHPSGVGTVKWTCKDDGGALHTEQLDNALYFPKSPINIISVTELAKKFNDEEGTGIYTKMNHSLFYWKNNKFFRKIHHSSSNLPELSINEGTTLFTWFTERFSRKIKNTINPTCCYTNQDLSRVDWQ